MYGDGINIAKNIKSNQLFLIHRIIPNYLQVIPNYLTIGWKNGK